MKKIILLVWVAVAAVLTGCVTTKPSACCTDSCCSLDDTNTLIVAYSNAVVDAAQALPSEVSTHLTPITPSNSRLAWRTNGQGVLQVKAATFMAHNIATNYWAPGVHTFTSRDQWFTVYPDLKEFCAQYKGSNQLLRIKELLGLPPSNPNDTVAEFWVSPEYVFRPAAEPAINSVSAGVTASATAPLTGPSDRVPTYWVDWFNNFYKSCDFKMTQGVEKSFPWTQLGYTYDWEPGRTNHVGLSEFVIPSGTLNQALKVSPVIEVEALLPAATYGK